MLGNLQGNGIELLRSGRLEHMLDDTAESADQFAGRTVQWWNQTIVPLARTKILPSTGPPQHILVVTHGGVIRTLLQSLTVGKNVTGESVVIGKCSNSSITIVDTESNGKGRVVQFNDTAHLAGNSAVDPGENV